MQSARRFGRKYDGHEASMTVTGLAVTADPFCWQPHAPANESSDMYLQWPWKVEVAGYA
jgi:hypothetical protein